MTMYVQFSFKTRTRPQILVKHILQRIYTESNGYNSVKIIDTSIFKHPVALNIIWAICPFLLTSTPALHPVP